MAKAKKTAFFCQNCGYESAKWMGQCPACREWNTFVEEPMAAKTPAGNQGLGSHSAAGRKPVHLTEISTGKEERSRRESENSTGCSAEELCRVP